MIHIYCGDGKGKTTAALGLAVRAAGRGKKVIIARFLKTDDSGEVPVLASIPGIRVLPCEKTFGFYFQMTEQQKAEAGMYYRELLEKIFAEALRERADVVILDEIMAALGYHFADEERLIELMKVFCPDDKLEERELILTGRNPSKRLLSLADYITEMKMVRHPYEKGIGARIGIEY